MKMEILLEPTSNKLMVEHAEYDESNTYVLERFNTTAGNPVKKILLKLNLSDHRSILTDLKDSQEGNFQVHSNPLFEFDDNFKSSTINPLFNEMEEDVEIENSNKPELLQTPLSNKGKCFDPGDDIDEINAFFAIEIQWIMKKVIMIQEEMSDPLHHEFAGEAITLPSRNDRKFEEYLSLMTVLYEILTSRSQEDVHANQSLIIESLPVSPIPVEDNDPLIPRPPPEPPDVEKCLESEAGILITKGFKGVSKPHDFMADILPALVRIYQKSQENRQKRASTDTRTEECTKAGSKAMKKSTLMLATRSACRPSLASCLSPHGESLPSVPDAYGQSLEALPSQPAASERMGKGMGMRLINGDGDVVAVSDVPEDGSRMHTYDHGGSEAPDGSLDSILSSEPKPLRKHKPLPPPSILFLESLHIPTEVSRPAAESLVTRCDMRLCNPSIDLSHGHRCYLRNCLYWIYLSLAVELSPILYLERRVDKHNLLRGGCSDSGISSLRSAGSGMYRDGGSGGSGDDGSNSDGIGGGDECAGGAMHIARRSPAEGGDSEIGGDGDGVVMARSLSTSASGSRLELSAPPSPPPPRPHHPHPDHQRHPQMNRRHHHLHHLPRP
ncbi:hypothetical protein Tco_0813193 [Tanacetum coccineum]